MLDTEVRWLVEVQLNPTTRICDSEIERFQALLCEYLISQSFVPQRRFLRLDSSDSVVSDVKLAGVFRRLLVSADSMGSAGTSKPLGQSYQLNRSIAAKADWHFYRNSSAEPEPQVLTVSGADDDAPIIGSHQWELPNEEFDDLWENLIYESNIKEDVLRYVHSMFLLSANHVNCSVISVNRMVLFHGPPGTGKTSLCKALAQRVSIRLNHKYKRAVLVEVNSHSLFSKWFSESGKLVAELFDNINTLLMDDQCMVCVLIDEVESLSMSRDGAISRNEPSDAVRVVNALLTQIDNIRRKPNALIFTTSNLSTAVDQAFIDRADIKRFIPPPPPTVIYRIYSSIVAELQRINVISSALQLIDCDSLMAGSENRPAVLSNSAAADASRLLYEISCKSAGLSGRALRKLPVIAFSRILQTNVSLQCFLRALDAAIDGELNDRENMK